MKIALEAGMALKTNKQNNLGQMLWTNIKSRLFFWSLYRDTNKLFKQDASKWMLICLDVNRLERTKK